MSRIQTFNRGNAQRFFVPMPGSAWHNKSMDTSRRPISIADAISPVPVETSEDVRAWQAKKIKERQQAADQGRFASTEAVKAVIRKFIPDNG